jgi:hypothetical protein
MHLSGAAIIFSLIATCHCASQDIITILNQQSGISTFTSLLTQFTDLTELLDQGPFTGTKFIILSKLSQNTDFYQFSRQTIKPLQRIKSKLQDSKTTTLQSKPYSSTIW